ncbi:NADH-quinone oxidoreductase subunit NuoN [Helicobacter sp. MIT 05-5293]|uniref:NADH-quinone oxidoreductase subunit NuoN n=1 Tax=Helicobacter sp. MIT 05-5293 TaxID=1548149 RepID=UPI00051D7CDC|nr:NADH-quinone oxidoreductase subunit NuoN [Helicobacter sp. MIT 05-5293]TLD81926.1 NADH-quinone oxidoreductase subunit NuoN [Helicobacter sp. MIT 05-5293]
MPELMSFSFSQLHFQLLIPMAISLLGGIVILGVGIFNKSNTRDLCVSISVLFVLLNLGFILGVLIETYHASGFFNLLLVDGISLLTQIIILTSALLLFPLFINKTNLPECQKPEFYALFLFSIAGFGFMVSSNNLILILLGLETASLSLYALIALHNRSSAFEASIKYFTMGSLATAFYAFGAMLLYTATGSVDTIGIAQFLQQHAFEPSPLAIIGFILMLCALGFKISVVPFHTWGPDVYEGSNSLLAAFISIAPKIATFAVTLRIFDVFISSDNVWIEYVLYALVILTMSVPNLIALIQEDVKRMLAYSSISHSGFVLGAILINTHQSHTILFFYWFLFLFTNIGAFAILWLMQDDDHTFHPRFSHPYAKFSGMIHTSPILAILLSVFMIALAGIPPLSVFWGKMYLMASALDAGYIALAIFMAINSTIAAFYYFKLVVYIFVKEPHSLSTNFDSHLCLASKGVLTISLAVSVLSLFLVQNLLEFISKYIGNSGF